ncbi:MAG: SH3 domain-containing protein, partial [Lachnospiraceae bacterium]|nr:SH3 domain-containing protein [Lachnospiraceae bacterium]
MISVFDIENTNYTGNGNAVLQPKECKLKNIAGGNYDLTMTHPIDPEGKWKHLVPGAVIRCPVPREEIENAFAGYEADVYKTNVNAELRESASAPSMISYGAWDANTDYSVGDCVSVTGWDHRNYQCTYFDANSGGRMVPPYNSSWWTEIADATAGAPVLVTLPYGTELYFVEEYNTTWYKMSTYYGIVGYVEKSKLTYYKHLTPSETQPRVITTQLFRIEKPTVDTKNRTVSVSAKHVSYDLNGVLIKDVNIGQASPAMALGKIVEAFMISYPGTIATNLSSNDNGTYTQEIKGKNGTYALLDPDKGIVSTFRAAY